MPEMTEKQEAYILFLSEKLGFASVYDAITAAAKFGQSQHPKSNAARFSKAVDEGRDRLSELTTQDASHLITTLKHHDRQVQGWREVAEDSVR